MSVFLLVFWSATPLAAQEQDFWGGLLKGLGFSQEPKVTITDATNLIEAQDYDGALKVALSLVDQQNYNEAMQIAKQLVPLKQLSPAVAITTKLMALNQHPEQAVVYDGYGEFLAISDLLIKEQDYNDALVILAGVMKRPDYLDDAQALVIKIRDLRNRYNSLGEQLLTALKNNDAEQAKTIIATMESVDKNPNEKTQVQIKLAKRSVNKIVFEKQVNAIMDAAAVLLKNKEYGNAILKYLEAEPVAKAEFAENQYGNITEGLVNRSWDDLKAATAAYVAKEAPLKTQAAAGSKAIAGSPQALDAGLASFTDPWKDFFGWRKRVWLSTQQFQSQASLILKSRNQDDFYLTYSLWLNQGRPTVKTPEGILFAFDQLWTETIGPWSQQIQSSLQAQYQTAKKAFDAGQYDDALSAFQGLRLLARSSLDLLALNNLQGYFLDDGSLEKSYAARVKDLIPLAASVESRLVLALQGAQASTDLKALALSSSDTTLTRAGLEAARASVRVQRENFIADADKTASMIRRETSLGQDGWKLLDPSSFLASWLASWNQFRQKAALQEAVFVDRRGKLDFDLLAGRQTQLQTTLADNRNLVEGAVKYPLQATQGLQSLKPQQDELQKDIIAFIALYDGETPDVKTPAVLAWPPKGRDLLTKLAQNQTLQGQLLATATANYALSQTLKQQGADTVPQINAAITAENFPQAKTLLAQMTALYTRSLSTQEDPVFRKDADAENKRLSDLINEGLARLVVKEVRQYITDGSQAFLDARFAQAEQILTKAKARWAETNTDPNQEVTFWLNLSTLAQGSANTREVSPTDPLYNEVQQLLNFARRDYNDAQALMKSGNTTDANVLFERALGTLSKILLIYPFNQEMGLLKLQIQKDQNPEKFPGLFKDKVGAAIKLTETNPAQAYIDLQDLDKIQPGDVTVAAGIKRCRIILGLERPPLDPAKKAQADRLYNQAKAAFDSGNTARFAQAKTDVGQAIVLIQPYTDAKYTALKDSIAAATPTVLTFTFQMNQDWEAILAATSEGSFVVAKALLDTFKKNYPAYVKETRVLAQENKITNGLSR